MKNMNDGHGTIGSLLGVAGGVRSHDEVLDSKVELDGDVDDRTPLRLNPSKAEVVRALGGTQAGQIHASNSLKKQLAERVDVITIPDFVASPSKGAPRKVEGLVLYRDLATEGEVQARLSQHGGQREMLRRLKEIDPTCNSVGGTQNAIGRIIGGTGFGDGENFFMFSPDVFCLESRDLENHTSFEFLDNSEWLLWSVGRCVEEVFGNAVGIEYKAMINKSTMAFTIYAGATAHENGHRCLPVRVIPDRDPRVAGLSPLMFDTLGELGADAVGVEVFGDVIGLRLAVYALLYRAFHYCRTAYAKDPVNGLLHDNDALGGAYCWAVMESIGVLRFDDGQFVFQLSDAPAVWAAVLKNLMDFLNELVKMPIDQQDGAARCWLAKMIPNDDHGRFVWPHSMAVALRRCSHLPVRPGDVAP